MPVTFAAKRTPPGGTHRERTKNSFPAVLHAQVLARCAPGLPENCSVRAAFSAKELAAKLPFSPYAHTDTHTYIFASKSTEHLVSPIEALGSFSHEQQPQKGSRLSSNLASGGEAFSFNQQFSSPVPIFFWYTLLRFNCRKKKKK